MRFPLASLCLALLGCSDPSEDASPSPNAAAAEPAVPVAWKESGATLQRARELAESGDTAGATALYRELLQNDPENAEAHHLLGRSLVALSRLAAGRGGAAPDAGGGVTLGRDFGMLREAVEHLERSVELEPENVEYLYWGGRGNHVAGNVERGAELLERTLELDRENGAAAKRLGLLHLDAGDIDLARRTFERAEALLPFDPGIPFQLGNILVEDEPEAARDAFRRSTAIDPTFAASYSVLIPLLVRLGDEEGAEQARADFERWRYFEEHVREAQRRAFVNPDDAALQLAAGELLLVKRAWSDALGYFQRGLVLDTTNAQAHLYCGIASRELGRLEDARNHVEETVYLQPNALEPRLELMEVVHLQGDDARLDELVSETDAAASSLPNAARLEYALTLLSVEKSETAASHFRAILETEPDNVRAQEGLAEAQAGTAE